MTYALVTVYHPDAAVADNIALLAAQTDRVYICDNSSCSNRSFFSALERAGKAEYIFFGENLGLPRAFDRVLKDRGRGWQAEDWVLFFDQDSRIEAGHVRTLIRCFEEALDAGAAVGCLGPVYYNTSSGRVETPRLRTGLGEGLWVVSSVITSSMLTTWGRLEQVGFWNEDLFLDLADWDLCWRLQAAGLICYQTDRVVLRHSVGQGEFRLGPLHLRRGEPYREYYQIRDCLRLLFRPYTPAKYRLRFAAMIFVRSPLHVLLLDRRAERLRYILLGLRDYFRGKTGPMEAKIWGPEKIRKQEDTTP